MLLSLNGTSYLNPYKQTFVITMRNHENILDVSVSPTNYLSRYMFVYL